MKYSRAILGLAATLGLVMVCGCLSKRPAETSAARVDPAADATDRGPAADRQLAEENDRLRRQIAEKDSRVRHLEQQLVALQARLDEAIQDVVRTKAKLRSVESRAEAASAMAETEIAMKAAIGQAGVDGAPELAQAEELLRMATEEFREQNYGGALYLTSQAKYQIRNVTARLDSEEKIGRADGEQAFALPLDLRVKTRSNVREGPGVGFAVLTTLEPETLLIGYSYKGEWIRVEGAGGAVGWIHEKLVARR